MCWPVCVCVYEREKMSKKDDKKKDGMEEYVEREHEKQSNPFLKVLNFVSVCGFVCMCGIQ